MEQNYNVQILKNTGVTALKFGDYVWIVEVYALEDILKLSTVAILSYCPLTNF